jgi:cyclopropane fatty-acyl-phospholipid synthase-like methyltransferase
MTPSTRTTQGGPSARQDLAAAVVRGFWEGRTAVAGPRAARFHGDHDPYDLAAVSAIAGPGSRVLDLGCGTCVVPNLLVTELGCRVHAVDFVAEFLTHALDHPLLTTEVGEAASYCSARWYDAILSLGVITYLDEPARASMYENCAAMLADGGVLLVKAQFGVRETVVVDTVSEELGARYQAIYPQLASEVAVLSEHFDVTVEDPYPAAFSRWANTHFHHLVCRRRAS